MIVAGLDLASRLTGVCVGDGSRVPFADAWAFEQVGEDYGWLIDMLDGCLTTLFDRFSPGAVVYEAPILVAKGGKNRYGDKLHVVRKLYSLGAHVEFVCRRRGIPCSEVSLFAMKRELTGSSHADKDDMVAVARQCGLELPKGPGAKDAADAFAAWLIGLRHYDKATAAKWDAVVWSKGRNALL